MFLQQNGILMIAPSPNQQRMRTRPTLLTLSLLLLLLIGCGSSALPAQSTVATDPTLLAATATTAPAAEQAPSALPAGCDDFFPFCNTVTISGAVTAEGSIGSTHHADSCAAWAAGANAPRILELPFIVGAGESQITVALTRIGTYNGPGTYTLAAQTTSGLPDIFPAIAVAERTFSNGEPSAATVTVAADGSGTIMATGLVEIASVQVTNPDPEARIDFAMSWRCQD